VMDLTTVSTAAMNLNVVSSQPRTFRLTVFASPAF